jgi:hypothetical protein
MTKQIISPTSSHSGVGVNTPGLPSVTTVINQKVSVPKITRATFSFSIAGPSNSFGECTFLGATDGVNYNPLAVLVVSPGEGNSVTADVAFSTPYTSMIANVNNIIQGVGAVPTTSISY